MSKTKEKQKQEGLRSKPRRQTKQAVGESQMDNF